MNGPDRRPALTWHTVRLCAAYARHPLFVLGATVRLFSSSAPVIRLRGAWRRVRWHAEPLRLVPPVAPPADVANAEQELRWLPPVRISGESHHAMAVGAGPATTFRLSLTPRSRVVTACALPPEFWADGTREAACCLDVEIPALGWTATRQINLDPGRRVIDRRWRSLCIPLPESTAQELVVRLSAAAAGNGDGERATILWGDPRIESRREVADMWRLVAGLFARVRRVGLRATLRYALDWPTSDESTARYRHWVRLNTLTAAALTQLAGREAALAHRPRISVLTPVHNTDQQWLRACIESVRRQIYTNWELCLADDGSTSEATRRVLLEYEADARIRIVRLGASRGISAATNAALEMATGEFVALLDHDDELAPEALFAVAELLSREPETDFAYSDEDKLDSDGERCDPHFKPDWSLEHFRSAMYTCHLMVLRTSLVRDLGGFRSAMDGAQDYDLALRLAERTSAIQHLPQVLYHWRKTAESAARSGSAKPWADDAGARALGEHAARCGLDADVLPGPAQGLYRVRHRIAGHPLISIIIPTMGGLQGNTRTVSALARCLRSIVQKSTYRHFEIVIAEDSALPDSTVSLLEDIPHTRVSCNHEGRFNFARKVNIAARHSRGAHLVLCNDDIEVIAPEWLEALLEFSQQEGIGAVGAKLVYPDGRLQHVGIVLGVCGLAAHVLHSQPGSTPGHGASALIVRNYSAVTAACMMTRRDVFERMGGFDERFASDFNDVDYCLRARRAGYRIVYTPYARLCHLESASFGPRAWSAADMDTMRTTWAETCARDPYYNPNLSRDFSDCRVRV